MKPLSVFLKVAILVALMGILLAPTSAALMQAADTGCTYMIPKTTEEINGLSNYAHVNPGDTLCLPAGERGNLKIFDLHGEPGKPITIRNSGGVVKITGTRFLTGGIGIDDSSNLRITGTGVTSQCGAGYASEDQACGIEITDTVKGIKINTKKNVTNNLEIDHVAVREVSSEVKTRGITVHPLHHQLVSGVYIHHNHVYKTLAEGIYIGTEPHGEPLEVLGKLENVEISYNLVEQTGYDGIKVKVAVKNTKVHHNVIIHPGLSHTPAHEGGIKMALSAGEFFNNFVISDREGIVMGRDLEAASNRYFNNVVVGAQLIGIGASESNAQVYNNTVVKSGAVGILAEGKEAAVYHNIVAETTGTPIDATKGTTCHNLIGALAEAGFLDPLNNNFMLALHSPAVDAGISESPTLASSPAGTLNIVIQSTPADDTSIELKNTPENATEITGLSIPPTDMRGVLRPQGDRPDLGAYERLAQPAFYKNTRWTPQPKTIDFESCK